MARHGYLLVKLNVFVARLKFESEMHEFWSEPGECAGDESNASEAGCRQHKRFVLDDILHVLDVRCCFHVVRAFALTALWFLNEVQQQNCDEGEYWSDTQCPVP